MMFGPRVRYCITYKANEPNFLIYTRKHYHNFKVPITAKNFEGAQGADLGKTNEYVLAEKNKLCIYNNSTFDQKYEKSIPVSQDDPNTITDHEILYMGVSKNQEKIGLILGKFLIKEET